MSQPDALDDIFNRLGSKNEDVRRLAARELVQIAASFNQEYTSHDGIKSALLTLFNRVFDFSKGSHYERLGAIQAIDAFVLSTKDDQPDRSLQKNIRLYEYLRPLLVCTDSTVMIAAAKVVGNMVEVAGAIMGESFFNKEVGQALQALDDSRSEVGRFSGVLVLHQFAHKAGALFYPHVARVLDKIWTPLRDSRTMVRERASMLLSACLRIVKEREKSPDEVYKRIFEEARSGLQRAGSTDSILGSLHAVGAMLDNQQLSMQQFYKDVCELTLRYRDSKELPVRKMVISLIPSMATYDTDEFETLYLNRSMAYLLQALQKPTDRDTAYVALGYMALTLGSKMRPFIDDVIRVIKEHLRQRGKKNAPAEGPIFQCLGYLARAVGPMLTRQMHDVLDLQFLCGLSDPLYSSLKDIADHIPPLLRTVQDRLLETISIVLTGHSFRPLGAPIKGKGKSSGYAFAYLNGHANSNANANSNSGNANQSSSVNANANANGVNQSNASAEIQALALHILGTFDFTGHALNEFVKDAVLPFLEHDSAEVRQEAVLASTQLFIHDPICNQTSAHSIEVVNEVLEKLLTVGITDPVPTIRQTVLEHLSEKFDRHLAQAEDIRCLFIALNDEVFRNRELAIGVIGRLALHNPAYVMPPLRKSLINLITELEYSTNTKQKEESAKLLCLLIAAAASLVKSYAPTLLTVLVRTAQSTDNSTVVSAECVKCIGELARVAGEELISNAKSVITLLVSLLSDQGTPLTRNAALKTLGQLASNTAVVITPYLDHPQLLGALFRLLQTESDSAVRLETIRTMGMLGALDPFKHKKLTQGGGVDESTETATRVTDITLLMNTMTPSNEEFYQTVAVHSLVAVLSEPTHKEYHYEAVEAVMLIFRTQRLRCVSFLPQILPAFLHVIRIAMPPRQEVYLKQLANLITIVKQHIRNFLEDVFALVHDFWNPNSSLQITIIHLVEAVAKAVEGEFKAYLPRLLQQILRTFDGDLAAKHLTDRRLNTLLHILKAFTVFGSSVEDYLHLVLPVIVRSFENPAAPPELRKAALRVTGQLCRKVNFSDHASQIIHPLIRTLGNSDADVRGHAMDTLCVLVLQFGPDYAIFIPMVNKVLNEHKITHASYEQLVTKLINRERLPSDLGPVERYANDPGEMSVATEQAKLPVNQQQLKAVWDCSGVSSKQDWLDWIKRLNTELMRESPSQAIRASRNLADKLPSFAREMFNVAFVSCWSELFDSYQEDLVHNLELAFTNPGVPPDVVNVILNLAEFMEHDEKPLAIESRLLGDYAVIFHAYAKALHYKELEFFVDASGGVVEDLISINQKLQQSDAAWGTLEYAQENMEMTDDVMWFEKLGRWEEALNIWTQRYAKGDWTEFSEDRIVNGQLSAYHALGEWDKLADLVSVRWSAASNDEKKVMAPLAAAASWSMNQWDLMDDYIAAMKSDSADRNFFRAILQVHRNQYSAALKSIGRAREKLDPELTSLTSESYGRAYDVIVRVQMLAELEEIIQYKDLAEEPHRQATMRKTWNNRLEGCQKDVEVWQRILQLRSLVLSPEEDISTWIQFVDLCRTSDRITLAEKTLASLVGTTQLETEQSQVRAPPPVIFAYYRLAWAKHNQEGMRDERISDLEQLRSFTETLAVDIGAGTRNTSAPVVTTQDQLFVDYQKLLARCYVELGTWQTQLRENDIADDPTSIIADYAVATELDPGWYQAWHTWALANFGIITQLEVSPEGLTSAHFTTYIVPAVEGFLKSIALSPGNALQDTLRLLTLWFQYGYFQGVSDAISRGLHMVKVDVWLEVIPQIIARLQTPRPAIQLLIMRLLQDVGRSHPQALVYPLHVASKSNVAARRTVALSITNKIREHSPVVVDQAELVSNELIRAAILWHEQWYDGLEEASKHYFAEHNTEGMFEVLLPLHEMIERGPETLRETSFVQSFGHELRSAREHLQRYQMHGDTNEIQQAWDIYYAVFQRLNRQLKMLNVIELQYVSPKLLAVRDLELAVPGTYQVGKRPVGIGQVLPTFQVISSKQRPRKFTIRGRDGEDYVFLLKGHEDLRQDERAMQLFGLVNTLLSADQECAKRHLHVQQYSITPLSPGAGLLGWVMNSDTLHLLIKNYRESRRILLDIEHRLMQQMAEDNYETLPLLNKVEVFQYALDNTTGQDLYRILWLKSRNSEAWLERRVTYTRSLGVNSMVGYILGHGDRHPSNLLLDQISGKIVHIDFGDCFEVAQQREKYPEKVPFRLTRMLIHAMEVCGITGTFSRSCEVTMEVLRDNRESLMAVLEAFVYDPLIAWRLTATNQPGGRVNSAQEPEDMQTRKLKANETEILGAAGGPGEVKNDRALLVIDRVRRKLTGRDFKPDQVLDVKMQVEKLVDEATRTENLCVAFVGWCSFW